jgi:hypothetical protein
VGAKLEDGGNHEVIFLQLKDFQMELLTFLKEAYAGVTNVIEHCRAMLPDDPVPRLISPLVVDTVMVHSPDGVACRRAT